MRTNATLRITTRTHTGTDPDTKQPLFGETTTDYRASRQDLSYSEIVRRTGDKNIDRMSDAFVPHSVSIKPVQVNQQVTDTQTGETGTIYAIDLLENSFLIRWIDKHPA